MYSRSVPVVPVADDFALSEPKDDGRKKQDTSPHFQRRSFTRHETVIATVPSRSWVDITFTDTPDSAQAPTVASLKNAEDEQVEELMVKRVWCCYSAFYRRTAAGDRLDHEMEEEFAKNRYHHFRTAFMLVSFVMMLGALIVSGRSVMYVHYSRASLLAGGVAPLYLCYGLCAWKRKTHYIPAVEKCFVGLLSFQMLLIVVAEWVMPDIDYGMLVMHIGFVHNFTPLGAGAMQLTTAAFGLLPFVVLKVVRFLYPSSLGDMVDINEAPETDDPSSEMDARCMATTGTEAMLVRIAVPIVIWIYQVVVTMRRDESLRLDWLSRFNLCTQQRLLANEKRRNEGLLGSMLPRKIIEALKANEPAEPQHFEDVTVVFIEICHFDRLFSRMQPTDVVEVLNIVYLEFDRLSDLLHVYKVETVGQVYMAVVGCPEHMVNHADVAGHFALAAQQSMKHIKGRIAVVTETVVTRDNTRKEMTSLRGANTGSDTPQAQRQLEMRGGLIGKMLGNKTTSTRDDSKDGPEDLEVGIHVGLNSGPLRAGIVGIDSPRYKLFGDTVNTASRMESTCEPGKIQMSRSTVQRLTKGMFQVEERGEIQVKGKGTMHTAYLCGYSTPGDEDNRRVVIEHGTVHPVAAAADVGEESSTLEQEKARNRHPLREGLTGPEEDYVRPLQCFSANDMVFCTQTSTNASSTSALVSAVLGRNASPESLMNSTGMSQSAASYAQGKTRRPRLTWMDKLELFLLVPGANQQPGRMELMEDLRQNLPSYQDDTRPNRIIVARSLTITWLLLLGILGGMDYFMDALEQDPATYRTAILVRTLGNTLVGLAYLLIMGVPAMGKVVQHLTIAMLSLQGVALLACGTVLYNSEPAIIALYCAYILFYTVCTVAQRLLLCLCAVTGYVIVEWGRCNLEGVRRAADNIAFLLVSIAAMACSVRLQEYLQHVSHYEQICNEKRVEEITLAKAAGSQLLTTLLPPHVVNLVGEGVSPIAEHHADVTIMFTDIKGFTAYSSKISAHKLVTVLNSMYSAFDEIISNWALHKVEIIGDAYFVSAGCPPPPASKGSETDSSEYAMRAVEVGLALLRTLPSVCDNTTVQMRVGLHTGSVVAGVVGKKGPRYHLFGSTVAYAEKMESHGIPGKVQLSSATHELLQSGNHAYDFEEREILMEGEEGLQKTWVVNRSNSKVAFQIQKKLMTQRRNNQLSSRPSSAQASGTCVSSRSASVATSSGGAAHIPPSPAVRNSGKSASEATIREEPRMELRNKSQEAMSIG